jgi:hypothetical protein
MRSPTRWLGQIFSVVAALGCLATAVAILRSSGAGEVSNLRLAGVTLMAVAAAWCALATFSPRLRRFNTIVLVNLILVLSGAEVLLRVMVDRLPISVVRMLPPAKRGAILRDRGLFTVDALQGSGLLYSWRPGLVIAAQQWVTIDRNGYRNVSVPATTDVVLLGDSVVVAQWVPEDMAALLHLRGISALNLGFSGYGPDQERDAYRKYAVQSGIGHRAVVVNFCGCNDLENARVYRDVAANGGTWKDYLAHEGSAFPFAFTPPWSVSILFSMPGVIQQAWQERQNPKPRLRLSLRRGPVETVGWPHPREAGPRDSEWEPALAALRDIAALARSAGADLIVAYYPDAAQLYLDGLANHPVRYNAARRDWMDARSRLHRFADEVGARFFDFTPELQRAIGDRIVVTNEGDYHPNQDGVRVMVEAIVPHLIPSSW